MDHGSGRISQGRTLGLVGYGRFGRLAGSILKGHFRVLVHDLQASAGELARVDGLDPVSLARAAACDIVVLAVPVRALADVLRSIAPRLRPGALVLDVASVKGEPARMMDQILPRHVRVVATHPLFGPNSTSGRPAGLTVVVCPVRGRAWRPVGSFLRRLGLRTIVVSPDEHDRQAALTQGLTHLLARAVADLDCSVEIRTPSFDLLMSALAIVKDDPPEVYEAITRGNPHVALVRDSLIRVLRA